MDISGKPIKSLGSRRYDIAALCVVRDTLPARRAGSRVARARGGLDVARLENPAVVQEEELSNHIRQKNRHIITVDVKGTIHVWHENGLAETILISQLPELTPKSKTRIISLWGIPTWCAVSGRG
jgi:hypothetical protein